MEYASGASSEAIGLLENFWPRMTREVQNLASVRFEKKKKNLSLFYQFFQVRLQKSGIAPCQNQKNYET